MADLIQPGDTVAVADGTGSPSSLLRELRSTARRVGGLSLFLGWQFDFPVELPCCGVDDVITYMGGYALRPHVESKEVRYLPERLGHLPKVISQQVRPDVVLLSARYRGTDLVLGSEVSWIRGALQHARQILVQVNDQLPDATDGLPLPDDGRCVVVGTTDSGPVDVPTSTPGPDDRRIAEHLLQLIPRGAAIQYPPGRLGAAFLNALQVPVRVDSGLLTDGVVDLAERGLLIDPPIATYLVGTKRLYRWAHGRAVIHPVEHTHDPRRLLAYEAFIAVNTALEVDLDGQVNVQRLGGRALAGIGGQPDYATAAARSSEGASIIALPRRRRGRSTLVRRLSAPASLSRVDVQIIVTELGIADLRGLDDDERRHAIRGLWGDAAPTPF